MKDGSLDWPGSTCGCVRVENLRKVWRIQDRFGRSTVLNTSKLIWFFEVAVGKTA